MGRDRGSGLPGQPSPSSVLGVLQEVSWGRQVSLRLCQLLGGVQRCCPWPRLPPPSPLLSTYLQIDLRYEARNLELFQCNFLNVNSVKFPTPLRPFVTKDVLVETYEVRMRASLVVCPLLTARLSLLHRKA